MSSDSRVIYYSTIHLNRREEILVQSIISLYNSKDNYEWLYKDGTETIVVVVGSEAKTLIKEGQDPFATIKEEQIVCVLGNIFYPKDARAVVPISLPIKALHLVDKLAHIEKNVIAKPFTIGYVAANQQAPAPASPPQNPLVDAELLAVTGKDTVEFWPETKPTEELETPQEPEKIAKVTEPASVVAESPVVAEDEKVSPTPIQVANAAPKDAVPEIDAVSILDSYKILNQYTEVAKPVAQEQVDIPPVAKETIDYVPPKIPKPQVQQPEKAELSLEPISYTMTSTLTAKPELVANAAPTLTEVVTKATPPPVSPVVTPIQPKVTVLETPKVATSIEQAMQQPASNQPQVAEQNEAENETSKRIKLLRWPKSEIIQRHPGNAILASMVINVPMSVEDMAKQSDLPLAVCQRFMDAVIESKVAECVDQVVEEKVEPVIPQEEEKEEVSQRKGILYRIRAALGLLRK